jgi:single-strand DNA-binding protein
MVDTMSGSLNKVMIIGNLGKDPEIRNTSDGREIANILIATNDSWYDKNSGERRDKTEWHRVVCFNPGLVNVIRNYLRKGSKVFIEGSLQTRKWQDQSGQDRYTTEIVLQGYGSNLTILDRPNGAEGAPAGAAGGGRAYDAPPSQGGSAPAASSYIDPALDDEIPF